MIKAGFLLEYQEVLEEKPKTPKTKPESVLCQTPLTRDNKALSSSDYMPLRKPTLKDPQEGKVKELEETVKNQSRIIDTLKQMCCQLEKSMKLEVQDKEEKFKEQLGQANDQLNHAVSTKMTRLLSKVNSLRKIRKDSKDNRSCAIKSIHDAINLLLEQKQIDIDKMEGLTKVEEVEDLHESLQGKIRSCTDKDLLPGQVEERNKARLVLNTAITGFINCVQDTKLDLLKVKLEVALTSLDLHIGDASDSTDTPVNTIGFEIVEEYKAFVTEKEKDLKEMHTLVNEKSQLLIDVHLNIIRLLNLNEEVDSPKVGPGVADIDDIMGVLEALIQEEVAKTKCSECEEYLQGQAVAALVSELNKQLASVQELRNKLEHYSTLQAKIQKSLSLDPDVNKALANKKNIRKLTMQLKHKQLDDVELKEAEAVNEEEVRKLKEELRCLYFELHGAFLEDDAVVNNLANLTREHFPELLLQHPELGIGSCLATNGLVKSGRAVEQYPLEELESCVFISSFCEKKCLIKEYFFRNTTSKDLFQRQAVEFHGCVCKEVIELQAVFYNKNERIGYLQVPYYQTLQEWLKTATQTESKKKVMKDVLVGLEVLHSYKIIHGSIDDGSVFVSWGDDEEPRGILQHYDFTEELESRVSHTSKKLNLPKDVAKCTSKFDLICFGHLLASVFIPDWKSSNSLADLNQLTEDAEFRSLLKGLISDKETSILTAQDALTMAYLKESIVNGSHLSFVEDELD